MIIIVKCQQSNSADASKQHEDIGGKYEHRQN